MLSPVGVVTAVTSAIMGAVVSVVVHRYNLVTEEEMKGMQWLDQQEGKTGMMDTKKN